MGHLSYDNNEFAMMMSDMMIMSVFMIMMMLLVIILKVAIIMAITRYDATDKK